MDAERADEWRVKIEAWCRFRLRVKPRRRLVQAMRLEADHQLLMNHPAVLEACTFAKGDRGMELERDYSRFWGRDDRTSLRHGGQIPCEKSASEC